MVDPSFVCPAVHAISGTFGGRCNPVPTGRFFIPLVTHHHHHHRFFWEWLCFWR